MNAKEIANQITDKILPVYARFTDKTIVAKVEAIIEDIVGEAINASYHRGCETGMDNLANWGRKIREAERRAGAAERERCAKIADRYHLQNYPGNAGIESPAQSIAARIRSKGDASVHG